LSKTLPPGTCSVTVQPKIKGAPPITEADLFTVRPPEIDSISPDSGSPGESITLNGKFFGKKKGKVYIGSKSCRVKSWKMEPSTGVSEVQSVVPRGLLPGATYDVSVSNAVGPGTLKGGFTIH